MERFYCNNPFSKKCSNVSGIVEVEDNHMNCPFSYYLDGMGFDSLEKCVEKCNEENCIFTIKQLPLQLPLELLDLYTKLEDLLKFRLSSRQSKKDVDDILRIKYTKIYKDDAPNNISQVILKLKQALWPPFRDGKSVFHNGDFGTPDNYEKITPEVNAKWADVVFTQEDRREVVDFVVSEDILPKYEEELGPIEEQLSSLVGSDLETYWVTNLVDHFEEKNEIYQLLLKRAPDLFKKLEILYNWLEDNLDFIELYTIMEKKGLDSFILTVNDDRLSPQDPQELFKEYINKRVNELDYYRVGDYFYYYNYHSRSRQSYGIAMVGYNIEKKIKEVIFDGEGYPLDGAPEWLITQFERIQLNYEYPQQTISDFFFFSIY